MSHPTALPQTPATHPDLDPLLAQLRDRLHELRRQFQDGPVTPPATFALENEARAALHEAGRLFLEQVLNAAEPAAQEQVPPRVRYRKQTYRRNKRTPARVATTFGPITLRSWLYLCDEPGEPGLHPLRVALGIAAGTATPALAERVARQAVDRTQSEVRAGLLREHGLRWSNDRLRAALRGARAALGPHLAGLQQERLLGWLAQAGRSRGPRRPVLAAGRDGLMLPLRSGGYHEAATATVSVYDRRGQRLGTVYLGQMPQAKQVGLSAALTALLRGVLRAYRGALPQLAYVTDKGSAPDEYYRQVLRRMKHPRDGRPLAWERVLDFYHVCGYVGQMAEALFGAGTAAGARWSAKMRRWLRDRRQGAADVARSATQLRNGRELSRSAASAFGQAYRYVRLHRRWMDYVGYRGRGLPIGSGVTEAACKVVFTQRFKRSGMRWGVESGQVVLDLRVALLSGVWEAAWGRALAGVALPEAVWPKGQAARSCQRSRPAKRRLAG